MKTKLVYPKIPSPEGCPLTKCVAFEKYDGTNIHLYLSSVDGWCNFGVRRRTYFSEASFIEAHPDLTGAIPLLNDFATNRCGPLDQFFDSTDKYQEAIFFFEFFGPNSFAGEHIAADPKRLVLIDIQIDGKMLSPERFLSVCPAADKARVVYQGKYNGRFIEDVRAGKYNVKEGVVCKGLVGEKLHMTKIKTNEYMQRLKEKYNENWKDYWE